MNTDREDGYVGQVFKVDCARRRLIAATAVAGGFATGMTLLPFVASLMPSDDRTVGGPPVEVDIGALASGESVLVEWQRAPIWVIRRSREMLASLQKTAGQVSDPNSARSMQPEYCRNETRSIRPEIFVVVGICTHLGCFPTPRLKSGARSDAGDDWPGGFLCSCHGSTFDVAGRVFKNKPAPNNLEIPPHRYLGDSRIVIGEEMGA
ncbi:MAG: ubiquinol-cytochrome c reductase iron-sulfur subunit [Sulfuricella sp.]